MVYVHRCSAIRKKSSDRRGKVHREGGWSIMVEYNRSQVRSRIFCFLLPNNCDCEGVLQKVSLAIRLGVAMAPFKEVLFHDPTAVEARSGIQQGKEEDKLVNLCYQPKENQFNDSNDESLGKILERSSLSVRNLISLLLHQEVSR